MARLIVGVNDLATVKPELAKEVSPNSKIKATGVVVPVKTTKILQWIIDNYSGNQESKNGDASYFDSMLIDTDVTFYGNKKLLWRCSRGHEWEATVVSRYHGRGCPFCSGDRVLSGFNDLATKNPKLAKEVSINSEIKATEVTEFSNKKLLWKCDKGHEWEATVCNRSNGRGCPKCSGSKMERDFAQLVKTLLPESITIIRNDRQIIKPYELDILIPSINLAFEFNGDYWHSDEMVRKSKPRFSSSRQFDDFKKRECEKHGVKLFFIWEKQWVNNYEKTVDRIKKIIAKNIGL